MTYTHDTEIAHIGYGLMDRALPKAEWTHAAHFAAAIWLLAHDDYDAFADMPGFIRRYNEATGVQNTDADGYHETITLASLRAAEHAWKNAPHGTPLYMIVNGLLASDYGRASWLLEYWNTDILFSVKARREWVAPDVKPLPF